MPLPVHRWAFEDPVRTPDDPVTVPLPVHNRPGEARRGGREGRLRPPGTLIRADLGAFLSVAARGTATDRRVETLIETRVVPASDARDPAGP